MYIYTDLGTCRKRIRLDDVCFIYLFSCMLTCRLILRKFCMNIFCHAWHKYLPWRSTSVQTHSSPSNAWYLLPILYNIESWFVTYVRYFYMYMYTYICTYKRGMKIVRAWIFLTRCSKVNFRTCVHTHVRVCTYVCAYAETYICRADSVYSLTR